MTVLDTRQMAAEFDQLWAAYPKPTQRPKAHLAYLVARKKGATLAEMLDALAWQMRQDQWTKAGGQFIPSLRNWLEDERWRDRPVVVRPVVSDRTLNTMKAIYGEH